jgi:sulfatase maturation enzyme AslB (radical SAM superfamily)
MTIASLPRKIKKGLPYLGKELRAIVSDHTPLFIAVPRTVHLWRSAPCNAKCIMCEYGFAKGEAYTKISRITFEDDLMFRAIEEVHELCGRGTLISYIAGEPTISRHIVEWVRRSAQLGMDFRFTTNGYRVNQKMASELIEAGLFNIGVSLESLDPQINEAIRPMVLGTQKTIDCIEWLRSERARHKRHVSVNVKTVLTNINLHTYVDIIKRWGRDEGFMFTPQMFEWNDTMPAATRELLCVKDIARLEQLMDELRELKRDGYAIHLSEQGMSEFVKLAREDTDHSKWTNRDKLEMAPEAPFCNIGTDNMWIQDGQVKLCPFHPPIGTMAADNKTTLKEMWHAEITRKVREGTRACRRLCTISCLRRTPLKHKVSTFMKIA